MATSHPETDDVAAFRCCGPAEHNVCRKPSLICIFVLKLVLVFHMEVGLPLQDAEAGRGGVSPDVSPDAAAAASLKMGNGSP